MRKIILNTIDNLIFNIIIWLCYYCYFGWDIVKIFLPIAVATPLIALAMRIYNFKFKR